MEQKKGENATICGTLRENDAGVQYRVNEAGSGNLLADLPAVPTAKELIEPLLVRPGLRIERIVSTGQASAADFWYDQDEAEWVVLLSGAATLRFAGETASHRLIPGDWVYIEAHRRHRVEWTDPTQASVWLAIHLNPDA